MKPPPHVNDDYDPADMCEGPYIEIRRRGRRFVVTANFGHRETHLGLKNIASNVPGRMGTLAISNRTAELV